MSKFIRYKVKVEKVLTAELFIDALGPEQALKQIDFKIRIGLLTPVWKEGEVYAKDVDQDT